MKQKNGRFNRLQKFKLYQGSQKISKKFKPGVFLPIPSNLSS